VEELTKKRRFIGFHLESGYPHCVYHAELGVYTQYGMSKLNEIVDTEKEEKK
jgi:hypothetical protein